MTDNSPSEILGGELIVAGVFGGSDFVRLQKRAGLMTREEGIVIVCRASMAGYAESFLNLSDDYWLGAISAGRTQSDCTCDTRSQKVLSR